MNVLALIFFVLFLLALFKHKKYEFGHHMTRHVIVIIFFFLILLIASHYVNINKIFDKDNFLSKTGAAVVETVKSNIHFDKGKIKELADQNLKKLDMDINLS